MHTLVWVLWLVATVQAIPYCDITQQQFRDYFADSDPTSVYFTDYANRISVTLNHLPESRSFPGRTVDHRRCHGQGVYSRGIGVRKREDVAKAMSGTVGICD